MEKNKRYNRVGRKQDGKNFAASNAEKTKALTP
jgi:hypothetical protein